MPKKISIIVPVFNDEKNIGTCIISLLNQDYLKKYYEIIIVDNNSTDDTKKIIKKFKNINYVIEKKPGASASRNKGLKITKGDIIAFTDSDCYVEKNWLKEIEKSLKKNDAVVGYSKGVNYNKVAEFVDDSYEELMKDFMENENLVRLDTRNCAVKKSVFEKVNSFDEQIKFNEDTEFSARVKEKDIQIAFNTDMIVNHVNPTNLFTVIKKARNRMNDSEKIIIKHRKEFIQKYFPDFINLSFKHRIFKKCYKIFIFRIIIKFILNFTLVILMILFYPFIFNKRISKRIFRLLKQLGSYC